jgi:putative molybdopterin biosynthesis protein
MSSIISQHEAFMSVKQVAEYLHLNEKKIYALVSEGQIPATKVTGKWMFPKELIDHWMKSSAHGGLLNDRLIIAGSDDPLLYRIIVELSQEVGSHALITYSPTGTRLGLDLLYANRVDACAIHWGPNSESHTRHPALLQQYSHHKQWVLIRAFRREQGLILSPSLEKSIKTEELLKHRYKWVMRQPGSGAQRFLLEMLSQHNSGVDQLNTNLIALSEREAAANISMGYGDVCPGTRAIAVEYGLNFISYGWESYDLALTRSIWFRRLFQNLITRLKSKKCQELADMLTGYDLCESGELVWGDD